MSLNKTIHRSGFTLIELLVVIAIIAILAAILFPVFAQAKLAAKKAVDISNFKQVLLGTMMYDNDFDDVYPLLRQAHAKWGCNNAGPGGAPTDCQQVLNAAVTVNPYVKNRPIWSSPNDTIFRNDCPSSGPNNPGGTLSYTYNYYGLQRVNGTAGNPYALGMVGWEDNLSNGSIYGPSTLSLTAGAVGSPADTVLMYPYYATFSYYDGQQAYSVDGRRVVYPGTMADGTGGIAVWPNVDVGYFWCSPSDEIAIGAYNNQTNWGWADGHVKGQERSQMMDPTWFSNGPVALANHLKNKMAADDSFHH